MNQAFPEEPSAPMRCHVQAPEPYQARAWYALETLLRPLGRTPSRDAAGPGLWYGPASGAPPGGDWIHMVLDPGTPARITRSMRGVSCPTLKWGEEVVPVLFPGGFSGEGDLVASAFYWLAACDEAAHPSRDRFGRPTAASSLLGSLGALEIPPVDVYRERLAAEMVAAGIPVYRRRWKGQPWCLSPTFDIDYYRKWRSGIVYREWVHYFLRNQGPGRSLKRLGRGLREMVAGMDPYREALSRIPQTLAAHQATGTFFFKAAAHSPHDVPYNLASSGLRRAIGRIVDGAHEIGLHTSFHAFNHPGYLGDEAERLTSCTGLPIRSVRTHYLRFERPGTPRFFKERGFILDSSLGYPDAAGFRNGTCLPFEIWDMERNRGTGVWELPLAVMESALFNREGLGLNEAVVQTRRLAETVELFGGILVALWHNVLWDEPDFSGWGEHFEATLEAGQARGAAMIPLGAALESWVAEPGRTSDGGVS